MKSITFNLNAGYYRDGLAILSNPASNNYKRNQKLVERLFNYHYSSLADKVLVCYITGTQGTRFHIINRNNDDAIARAYPNGRYVTMPLFA